MASESHVARFARSGVGTSEQKSHGEYLTDAHGSRNGVELFTTTVTLGNIGM